MSSLSFALSVTGPIFLTMLAGAVLARAGVVGERFVDDASRLVFLVTLPLLLFSSILTSDAKVAEELPLLAAGLAGTLVTIALAWLAARPLPRPDRSSFIQGAFRGNLGIVGLAWAFNAYGQPGLAQAALLMAVVTIVYNIAAVTLFAVYSQQAAFSWTRLLREIASNPLILAIVCALIGKQAGLVLPALLQQTTSYLASMTLPLALLCIGASLDLGHLRRASGAAVGAAGFKLLLVPAVLVGIGLLVGLPPASLGVLFLMGAAPSATVSFIMARAMGGNSQLAANIVALSTLLAVVTASAGLVLLQALLS